MGSKIKCEHLGMGAPGLWHGTPDGRFRGIVDGADTVMINHLASHSPNSSEDEMGSEHGNSSEETDGASVVCEAKLSDLDSGTVLPQLVKTAVVSSFTESYLHPNLNPMVPVILVNAKHARIYLYVARKDILLISEVFQWLDSHTATLCKPGITLLWAMLNHR